MSQILQDAVTFAANAHAGQTRRNGTPYISHPLRVMIRAQDAGHLEHEIIGAVLHDVVEDTGVGLMEIERLFGLRVSHIVDALTRREGETYEDFILRCKAYTPARWVKIHDIQDNLADDPGTSQRARYEWALNVLRWDA